MKNNKENKTKEKREEAIHAATYFSGFISISACFNDFEILLLDFFAAERNGEENFSAVLYGRIENGNLIFIFKPVAFQMILDSSNIFE